MGRNKVDLTGKTFNYFTVICDSGNKSKDGSVLWTCKCKCGKTVNLTSSQLCGKNHRISCGCYRVSRSRKYNTYSKVLGGKLARVYDSKGNYALVDSSVLPLLKPFYWFMQYGYFKSVTGNKHSPILMHNFVYENVVGPIPKGYEIDHKNRNKSDNRVSNLRPATRAENCINRGPVSSNTSGYPGVSYRKGFDNYRAYITVDNKQIHLGVRRTAEEAYTLRLEAEKKYFGEFSSNGGDANVEQRTSC